MGDIATAVAAPQHLRALERANHVRLGRADLKRKIGAGDVSAADVIASPPWHAEGMTISELLMSQRRWGRARCKRLLLSLGLPENKRLGTLTERQRGVLVALLGAKGPARPAAPPSRRPELAPV